MLINNLLDRLKKYKFFSDLLTPEAFFQMVRYVITGFTGFVIEYFLFYTFKNFVFERYLPIGYSLAKDVADNLFNYYLKESTYSYLFANAIAYVVVFWFNFLVNRIWSFKSKVNIFKQLRQYGVLFVFNLIAISALMWFLTDKIGIMSEISKVLVMGMVVCWNFILYKKVIYK